MNKLFFQPRVAAACLLLPVAFLASAWSLAGDQRYDFDELGRLLRSTDESGRVTSYRYDPVGNLLEVRDDGTAVPPAVDGSGLDSLRCGESVQVTIEGSDLEGARVTASDPGLKLTDVRYTDSGVSFTLSAECATALGDQTLLFETAGGTTSIDLRVAPELPLVFVTPAPLAVPPDGSERPFLLRLSHADTVSHSFQITSSDSTVLSVATASLSIPAGETEARGGVSGLKPGQAFLEITSATLPAERIPAFVTADFKGANTSFGRPLGVLVPLPPADPDDRIVPVAAPETGVLIGSAIQGVDPSTLLTGEGPVDVVVEGVGLEGATAARIVPDDGLTIGNPSIAADGTNITVPVAVAEEAPRTLRRFVIERAGTPYPAVPVDADRVRIALPPPVIHSIDPLFIRPGDTGATLTVRGLRLLDVQSVSVLPSDGVQVDARPEVNEDGTLLTVRLGIAPDAEPGERVVIVQTAGGVSDDTPTAANTLRVVLESGPSYEDLTSPALGVVRDAVISPAPEQTELYTAPVGVAKGPSLTGLQPGAGAVGETLTITVTGHGLESADSIAFEPPTGISAGAPSAAADGESLTAEVTIAPGAPLTVRRLELYAGGQRVLPARSGADLFQVTPPPPSIDYVSPLYLVRGTPSAALNVVGRNLQDAGVQLLPASGITVGSVSAAGDGSSLEVQVAVDAGALTGARVLEITTPGGSTGSSPTAANTVYVVTNAGPTYSDLTAPEVGVLRTSDTPVDPPSIETTLLAARVGVQKQTPDSPVETDRAVRAQTLGVALGPVARSVAPEAVVRGTSAELVITGDDLAGVTAASFVPAEGITISGAPAVDADGKELRVTVSVDAGASPTARGIVLQTATAIVPFAESRLGQLRIGYGQPQIFSIEPILAVQGDVLTLLVRGDNLFDAEAVTATPGDGMHIGSRITVNESGTELTVPIAVDADAPLGPRVIRVAVPGAVTTDQAEPANTFTVYESVPE